jgi:hypothetical protein
MKNKFLALILTVAVICGAILPSLTLTARAAEIVDSGDCGANVTWSLDSAGTLTISGSGEMYNYELWGYPLRTQIKKIFIESGVTSIGKSVFNNFWDLTSVAIPDSVTSIGDRAFDGCDSLTSIAIPDSVTSIGYRAFANCTALTSITIPDGITSIGDSVLSYCTRLTSVTIPDSVTSIGNEAFGRCTALASITIPDSVTNISSTAFKGCANLTDFIVTPGNPCYFVQNGVLFDKNCTELICYPAGKTDSTYAIPNDVVSIGESAFSGCTNLVSITISDSVTNIGDSVFYECTNLTGVTIPDSVTSIGSSAFNGCTNLASITIPDSVTSIGDSVFYGCTSLTGVTISDSVTSIGDSMFYKCTSLTSVTIPDSVTSIGDAALFMCTSLPSVTIPDSVTHIGKFTFQCCYNLTSFTIPNSVTRIDDGAFYDCTNLASISIPDSVTSIGESAFSGCTNLVSITISDSVTNIEWNAFRNCTSLTSVTIPGSVTNIGDFAFGNCTALQNVYFKGNAPDLEAWHVFSWVDEVSGASVRNPNLTIYYIDGKEGWTTPMWNGYPTATWDGVNPPKPHEHDYKAVVTAPTCTEQGYTTHTCVCGDSYRDSYTNALGHDSVDHEAKAATCTEIGWEAYQTCNRCDYTTYKEIPVKGHTPAAPVRENEVAPTCTVGGSYDEVVYCSVCKKELSREAKKLDALGHDYVDHEAKAATCTEVGWEAYQTCSRCDYTTYKEISALGHDWGDPVYEWADDHSAITATRVCKRDPDHAETENGVVTSAVTKEATYDAEGEITYTAAFANPAFEPQTAVVSLPRLERPAPTPAENPFTDVKSGSYYYDAVLWAVEQGVTAGTSETTFSPDEGCTRAQVVTFLWRAAGKPDPASSKSPFSDVKEGAYYYNAVLWAVEKGITNGTSDKTFSPDETCTRAQIVTFLWRYEGQPAPAGTSNPFADVKPNAYFGSAVLWAVEKGITNGTSATTFDPEDTCTRAQVVTFLYRDIVKS